MYRSELPAKFALIGHPPDLPLFRAYVRHLKPEKTFRDELILKLFEWSPAYKVRQWEGLEIPGKGAADGIMIMVPFLPEMKDIKLRRVVEKIEGALAIAADEGCATAALGAFTSIVLSGREPELSKKYGLRITSGNTMTAALIVRSIEELVERFELRLENLVMTIIGASGDIGSGCMLYFGSRVREMKVTARNVDLLRGIVEKQREHAGCPVRIGGEDCNRAFAGEADVVILVTSAYRSILRLEDFGRGTIVCDASAPLNVEINGSRRSDVFLYHGGVARLPFALDPGFDIGLAASNTMYGCMTEGILTAVDPALPGSWGRGNITLEKLRAYLGVLDGASAGVTVEFSTGDRLYSSDELKEYESTWRRFRSEAPREGREKS